MRDYTINIAQLVNRLIPHFVRKPVHKAYLQALVKPLEATNNSFKAFVAEKRIEASLTSQTLLFENYLNRTFSRYFTKPSERIQIIHSTAAGLPIYFDIEEGVIDPIIYDFSESFDGYEIQSLSFLSEQAGLLPYSFRLILPRSFDSNRDIVGQIVEVVEKYKIGGFGYDIIYV